MRYKSLPLVIRSGAPLRPLGSPSAPIRPRPTSRLRDWIATAPILILVIGLVIGTTVMASVPSMHLEGVPQPGGQVMVHGDIFPEGDVQLWWDGSSKGMPPTSVESDGTFVVMLDVPATAGPGVHLLAATAIGVPPGQLKQGKGILATLQVTIAPEQPPATSTPVPSTHHHRLRRPRPRRPRRAKAITRRPLPVPRPPHRPPVPIRLPAPVIPRDVSSSRSSPGGRAQIPRTEPRMSMPAPASRSGRP